ELRVWSRYLDVPRVPHLFALGECLLKTAGETDTTICADAVRFAILNHVPWWEDEHSPRRQWNLGQPIWPDPAMMTRGANDDRERRQQQAHREHPQSVTHACAHLRAARSSRLEETSARMTDHRSPIQ